MEKYLEVENQYRIDYLQEQDISALIPIICQWKMRNGCVEQNLVDLIVEHMYQSVFGNNNYIYFVARDLNGVAIGMMGIRSPEGCLKQYANEDTVELINAYIQQCCRGQGIGKQLMTQVFDYAHSQGFSNVILHSGERYKYTAWSFYNKYIGEPIAVVNNYNGLGEDSYVWRKSV